MTEFDDIRWRDTQRMESWAGEIRLNLIRLIAIMIFYGRHLVEAMASPPGSAVRGVYHVQVTWICLVWAGTAMVLHARLKRRHMTSFMKYLATGIDAGMITILCAVGSNPQTPLIFLYFPLIVSAPLRLSIRLVYAATAAAMAGYLIVLAHYAWYIVGFKKYYSTPGLRIPRSQEIFVLLAMLTTGVVAGQIVRQMRRISAGYPVVAEESANVLSI